MLFNLFFSRLLFAAITLGGSLIGYSLFAIAKDAPKPVSVKNADSLTVTCNLNSDPPTTILRKNAKSATIPILTWYSNYLIPHDSPEALCQSVAQKLQAKYQTGEPTFLAYQQVKNEWQICFVSKEGDDCTASDSTILFSLNAAFKAPPCVMENVEPNRCPTNPAVRGPLLIVPGGTYKPFWWIFRP